MFMEVAIGAIGIGIVLMVGYLVIAQVRSALPSTINIANPCLGIQNASGTCLGHNNATAIVSDWTVSEGLSSTQATVFAGFGLIAVGIIVLAAFGLINVFRG